MEKEKRQTHRFIGFAGVLMLCISLLSGCGVRQKTIIFNEHLTDTVLVLDGTSYPLSRMAFYVAYEEQVVQEQALIYDASEPTSYWNTHINGRFMRVAAREEAMNQAIHDFIFYDMAQEMEMELDDDEIEYANERCEDFWSDLGEYGQAALGITQEELEADLKEMALSQKCQEIYAAMENVPETDYDVNGIEYETLLTKHQYKIKNSVWNGVPFGRVTLEQ
jgi:hypothetical protein